MRWIVGGKAAQRSAASPSQMGRFETQWLAAPKNFAALADLSGQWIDLVHGRRPPRGIVLDMDSSVSPTHGEQEPGPATIAPSCFLCPSKTHGAPAHGVIPPDRHLDLVGIDPKAVNDNDEGSPAYILSMLANIKQQRPALPF
jgi:hypothetical protein